MRTDEEFLKLIAEMRRYQRYYFERRVLDQIKQEYLIRSKVLEKEVDKELNLRGL